MIGFTNKARTSKNDLASAEVPVPVVPRPALPRAPLALQPEPGRVLLAQDRPHEGVEAVGTLKDF